MGYVCDFNRTKLKRKNKIAPLKSEKVSTTPPLFAIVAGQIGIDNHGSRRKIGNMNSIIDNPSLAGPQYPAFWLPKNC